MILKRIFLPHIKILDINSAEVPGASVTIDENNCYDNSTHDIKVTLTGLQNGTFYCLAFEPDAYILNSTTTLGATVNYLFITQ